MTINYILLLMLAGASGAIFNELIFHVSESIIKRFRKQKPKYIYVLRRRGEGHWSDMP